jgi:hypothetical protein
MAISIEFNFDLGNNTLTVDDVWPDKDAPAEVTAEKVLELVDDCGGVLRVIDAWDFLRGVDLEVVVRDKMKVLSRMSMYDYEKAQAAKAREIKEEE